MMLNWKAVMAAGQAAEDWFAKKAAMT